MSGSAGTAGIKASRPAIVVGGTEDADLSQGLLRMSLRDDIEGLCHAELRFGNWGPKSGGIGFLYFDRKKLDFGKEMQLKLGDEVLFEGRVSAIEAEFGEGRGPEIAVLLEDRLQDLRMTRRTRTFTDVADADVIRRLAGDHGLTPTIDISGPTHKVLAQVNQSDLAFLRERARAAGAELWIEGRTLYAKTRSARSSSPLKLKFGAELREFIVLADLAHQRTSVNVAGWDVKGKRAIDQKAEDAAISGELGADASGASILRGAFAERKETVAHAVPLSSDEAKLYAEAWFRSAARRFVTGRGIAQPDGKLRVGAWVDLDGLGPLFNGKYYVAEVRHVFDGAAGFLSQFMAERPGLGPAQ